ncbi:hypothetical protein LMH87_002279 [Akanthomyces muscarius]|uniref:Mid2 domain-containing protein n=1 Tax=Akanthomyces muscarius TaxID=2231603 RepID=A0A9W8UJH5_AKAMU|nr:hypothetical protein LMH87_002279 [Akanthomyces muscarius]KAJ4147773.1 hypothetical protein LMH87_002279 [Akanthomyces muscarius]
MYSPRFLLLMLAALCVVDAALVQNFNLGRQAGAAVSATGSDKESSTGSATTPASSTPSSSPTPSSTTPPSSSSTAEPTSTPTPTSTPAPTSTPTSSASSTQAPPTSTPVPTSSQQPTSQPTSQPTEQPTTPQEEPTSQSTYTSFVTSTSTPTPASTAKSTPTPGLNSDKDGATSGMPAKTRNTVIGVVVGIGGAILLGALGMVAYRIWGRKKQSEEADGLMSYDMSTNGYEKHEPSNSISSSNNQRTPFQSTLENYHQPSNVNPSSNF